MYRCHHLQVFKIGLVIIFSFTPIPTSCESLRCPFKCKCSTTSIICVDNELTEVPDFRRITSEPTAIDLSKNDIEEIKSITFNYKRLEAVVSLKLNDNVIFHIHSTAFAILSKLEFLDLANNLLEDFPNDLIVNNKHLKDLNLAGNLFGTQTPKLKSDSLQLLDLSFSKLSQISKENVDGLPNLRLLYLQANNLKEFDYNIIGIHIRFVDLAFNTWKCQCETIKMFDHLVKNNFTVISNPVQCIYSYRRYEDVYDSRGPINYKKWCQPNTARTSVNVISSVPTTSKSISEDTERSSSNTYFELTIWIGLAITLVVVFISGVSLIVVLKRQNKSKNVTRSRNTAYSELPTKNIVISSKKVTDRPIRV